MTVRSKRFDRFCHQTLHQTLGLSARLVRDLKNKTITLNSMTWHLTLSSPFDSGIIKVSSFVTRLARSVEWMFYSPTLYRQTIQKTLLPCSPPVLPPVKWVQLWSLNTLPEARSLCYRFLYNKLYCQGSVSRIAPDVSGAYQLCQVPLEDINHLLIMCHFK